MTLSNVTQVSEATIQAEAAIAGATMEPVNVTYGVKAGPVDAPPIRLYTAMQAARAKMAVVAKSGFNKFDNYSYATLIDYVDAIQGPLDAHGLLVTNDVIHHEFLPDRPTKSQGIEHVVRITLRTRVIHCDTGEWMHIETLGEGQDRGDKAYYKAVTGARKYALAMLFNLATDDDPETDSHENEPGKPAAKPPVPAAAPHPAAKQAAAANPEDTPEKMAEARGRIAALTLEQVLALVNTASTVGLLSLIVDGVAEGPVYKVLPEWEQVIVAIRNRYIAIRVEGDDAKFSEFLAKMKGHRAKLDLDKQAVETFQPATEAP